MKKAVSIFELGKNKVPRSRILDCVTLRLMLDLGYRSHVIEWDNPDKLLDYINRENVRSEAFSYVEEIIRCPNQDCGTPNIFHNCVCLNCGCFLDDIQIKCANGHLNPNLARFCFVDPNCNLQLIKNT